MGKPHSILAEKGYIIEQKDPIIVSNKDGKFLVKKIHLNEEPRNVDGNVEGLISKIETLQTITHTHIVSSKNSFKDNNIYYVVMDYCQDRSLATKIKEMIGSPEESEVLSYIVEICMALRKFNENGLLHKDLRPETVFLTDFGIVCLDGLDKIHENSSLPSIPNPNLSERIDHLAPEVLTDGAYDAKSDIWSLGCILFELCTQKRAFSGDTPIRVIPIINNGPYPSLPENFSPQLQNLLNDIFKRDSKERPTASEILGRPFIISCLSKKAKTTVEELDTKLNILRDLANGLERVHQGTTIGSLAGGVIGAVGGITSIVGLILAPFTLGASLIVTGVGVGVGAVGGATAGVSNITNLVNQTTDRRAVHRIIKEIEHKMNAVVTWVQEIGNSLQTIRSRCDSTEDKDLNDENLTKLGLRAGRGLGGVARLVRLVRGMNVARIAAQATRIARVAEVATGVFSSLFVAVDLFFIAMDAREIHRIRRAKAADQSTTSEPVPTVENCQLLMEDSDTVTESQNQSPKNTPPIKSEIMKFVRSIRQAADNLQKVLNELRSICSTLPSLGDHGELE